MGDNINVIIRVRQLPPSQPTCIEEITDNTITLNGKPKLKFSKVYNCEPELLYQDFPKKIVESFLGGQNGAVIMYGVTGSGKTYTVDRLMQCIISEVLKLAQRIDVSYMEIYNEYVYDLVDAWSQTPVKKINPHKMEEKIEILGSVIRGITEAEIKSQQEITDLIGYGKLKRTTEATLANANSSRSHSIIRLNLNNGVVQSFLYIVDLAGSECSSKSGDNKDRIREASFINKSLLALSTLVFNLSRGYHTSYRDSKLTKILEPCVGGNSKTLIICCLNPLPDNLAESLVTLEFGKRAAGITQSVYENIKRIGVSIADYIGEILRLRDENKQLREFVCKLKETIGKNGIPIPTFFETCRPTGNENNAEPKVSVEQGNGGSKQAPVRKEQRQMRSMTPHPEGTKFFVGTKNRSISRPRTPPPRMGGRSVGVTMNAFVPSKGRERSSSSASSASSIFAGNTEVDSARSTKFLPPLTRPSSTGSSGRKSTYQGERTPQNVVRPDSTFSLSVSAPDQPSLFSPTPTRRGRSEDEKDERRADFSKLAEELRSLRDGEEKMGIIRMNSADSVSSGDDTGSTRSGSAFSEIDCSRLLGVSEDQTEISVIREMQQEINTKNEEIADLKTRNAEYLFGILKLERQLECLTELPESRTQLSGR
jgi:centromeric protein E